MFRWRFGVLVKGNLNDAGECLFFLIALSSYIYSFMFLFLFFPHFNASFNSSLSLPVASLHFPVQKFQVFSHPGFGPSSAGLDVSPLHCTPVSWDAAPAHASWCGRGEARARDGCTPCTPACPPLPGTPLGTPGGTRRAASRSRSALVSQSTHSESPEPMRSSPR